MMTAQDRTAEIFAMLERWLRRFSPPIAMRDNAEAQQDEVESLGSVLVRFAPQTSPAQWVKTVLDRLEYGMKTRAWPTKGELAEVCTSMAEAPKAQHGQLRNKGDKAALTRDQIYNLENKVLPTARRWLSISGLSHHGRAILDYWGEP